MKYRIKKEEKEKEKQNKTKKNNNTSTSSKFDPNKKKNVLEWEQERAVCPGADLNQSNIYQRKVEKTCIIASTCMINFRIESKDVKSIKWCQLGLL